MSPEPGFQVATDHLRNFAKSLHTEGERYTQLAPPVPSFSGSNYVPGVGLPPLGLFFAGSYNSASSVAQEAIRELGKALDSACTGLNTVADNYFKFIEAPTRSAGQPRPPAVAALPSAALHRGL
jgi:hypothetical protein